MTMTCHLRIEAPKTGPDLRENNPDLRENNQVSRPGFPGIPGVGLVRRG